MRAAIVILLLLGVAGWMEQEPEGVKYEYEELR